MMTDTDTRKPATLHFVAVAPEPHDFDGLTASIAEDGWRLVGVTRRRRPSRWWWPFGQWPWWSTAVYVKGGG